MSTITQTTSSGLEQEIEDDVYILTPEEEEMIEAAEAELDAGLGIPHDIVMKEIREWFHSLPTNSHKDRLK